MREHDGRTRLDRICRQIAHGLAGAAMHESERVLSRLPDSPDKQFLLEVTPWVIERNEL